MQLPSHAPSDKPLHQLSRAGVPASRAVVKSRLAGERRCSTDHGTETPGSR